ncbi:hypothetical protein [Marinobacter sp. S6332]|uniref:hypothetical protein n=1 Tax=Marinobacter sp. S6332 TaxID=2926403 RepID=UPI001FF2C64B|nr:hypothetical protein [Marinobacter sp. S6332]MCK0165826.1 hypothetical protein [Marinobacter sp. S6332]
MENKAKFVLPPPEKATVSSNYRDSSPVISGPERINFERKKLIERIKKAELETVYCRITKVHRFVFISLASSIIAFFNGILFDINPISKEVILFLNIGMALFIFVCVVAPYKNNKVTANTECIKFPSIIFPNKTYKIRYSDIRSVKVRSVFGQYSKTSYLHIYYKNNLHYKMNEFYLQEKKFSLRPAGILILEEFLIYQVEYYRARLRRRSKKA